MHLKSGLSSAADSLHRLQRGIREAVLNSLASCVASCDLQESVSATSQSSVPDGAVKFDFQISLKIKIMSVSQVFSVIVGRHPA